MKRLLVVDDEPNVRLNYRITLEGEGYDITETGTALDALQKLRTQPFELAILDMRMPEMDGLELLAAMRQEDIGTPDSYHHGVQRCAERGSRHEAWGHRLPAKTVASRGTS